MSRLSYLALFALFALLPSIAWAQNEGQAKLDEAAEMKLDAKSPEQLAKVIELCEQAIATGLDDGNKQLANQILAASAFQRAQMMVQQLPKVASNPGAVRKLRTQTVADLDKALGANPDLVEALILKTKLEALPGGSRESAMKSITRAIELLKDKPVDQSGAYILRAGLQESTDDKLKDLKKAIEVDSTNSDAWQARLAVLLANGKLEEAVIDAEKLLEKDPGNLFALEAAIQSLFQLKKFEEATKLLSTRIEKDPSTAAIYRARARAYIFQDKNDKAMEDLNKALELDAKDAESLILRSQLYFDMGDVDKANRDVSDALQIQPDAVQGVLMRSLVASREGRYADAIGDMEMLVRFDPSQVAWVMQLASLYQADKRPRLAIRLLDELLKQKADEWRAVRLRGDAKLSINDHVGAIADYEKSLKLVEKDLEKSDLDYSGLLNNLAWVLATTTKDELRNGKRALELGLKACEATEYKQAHILSTLAAAYAESGDFDNARKWSEKAVELGGEEGEDGEQLEQLKKELESYKENKPWREEQKTEENAKPLVNPADVIET
jgi:tetratricopeptide (TPR) repeat protein